MTRAPTLTGLTVAFVGGLVLVAMVLAWTEPEPVRCGGVYAVPCDANPWRTP